MSVPEWVPDAIFYQIFPDRFANGDPRSDPPNVQSWGASPTRAGYQGGDLAGIEQRLDYLLDLGVNAIYLNPIFLSPTNHRYHTTDYYHIDPWLGSSGQFSSFIRAAHQKNIRVILDGVFNHCSRGFFAFNDLLENEAESPYRGWFHVRRFPLRAFEPGRARNYSAWWGYKSLPKFNTDNPAVRSYLLEVARYWIEQGIDGWRLDVPNEIDDDAFWARFRQVVLDANPQAYLLGEIWNTDPRWANDTHFDGLMNYPARTALLELLSGKIPLAQFAERIEALLGIYPRENTHAMYNLLGSHDTERVRTHLNGDLRRVSLAFLFLLAYPGVPGIYYGDEIGLQGGKDPECRGAFPWDVWQWETTLRDDIKRFITARKSSVALRRGDFRRIESSDAETVFAFVRESGGEQVLVVMNTSDRVKTAVIPTAQLKNKPGRTMHSLLNNRQAAVENELLTLTLAPYEGDYLV